MENTEASSGPRQIFLEAQSANGVSKKQKKLKGLSETANDVNFRSQKPAETDADKMFQEESGASSSAQVQDALLV